MIAKAEIQNLKAIRHAIWKRQNKRCMIVKAIKGIEPYCWRYKIRPEARLNTINEELDTLKRYRTMADALEKIASVCL